MVPKANYYSMFTEGETTQINLPHLFKPKAAPAASHATGRLPLSPPLISNNDHFRRFGLAAHLRAPKLRLAFFLHSSPCNPLKLPSVGFTPLPPRS